MREIAPGVWHWRARHEQIGSVVSWHHERHSWQLREQYGCTVYCIRNGLYELDGRAAVEAFELGDELSGGITVYEIDTIRLLDLEFELLLVAHGEPLVGGAKEALRKFASGDG